MKLSVQAFLIIMFGIVFIFTFVPIYPTDLMCPPVVDYCDELPNDKFSMLQYMRASAPP